MFKDLECISILNNSDNLQQFVVFMNMYEIFLLTLTKGNK